MYPSRSLELAFTLHFLKIVVVDMASGLLHILRLVFVSMQRMV